MIKTYRGFRIKTQVQAGDSCSPEYTQSKRTGWWLFKTTYHRTCQDCTSADGTPYTVCSGWLTYGNV